MKGTHQGETITGLLFGTLPPRCVYITRGNSVCFYVHMGGVPVAVTVTDREGRSSRPAVTLKLQFLLGQGVCECVGCGDVKGGAGVSVN